MKRICAYDDDLGIVVVRTFGIYELESEIETLRQVKARLDEHGGGRCLFDHREAHVLARTAGSYDRPRRYDEIGFDHAMRMAIVVREKNDDLQFYENVCVNRGWQVSIFDDYAAAVAWLTV